MHTHVRHVSFRWILVLALGACAVLAASAGGAQTLGLPPAGQPLGPPQAAPIGPRLAQPASITPQVRGDIGQRPELLPAMPERGPAQEGPQRLPATEQPVTRQPPGPLLGPTGQPLPGAIRIAPNRIYDPLSQRYYWTSGPGLSERVLP